MKLGESYVYKPTIDGSPYSSLTNGVVVVVGEYPDVGSVAFCHESKRTHTEKVRPLKPAPTPPWRDVTTGTFVDLGADPEMFVVRDSGEVIPSWKFLAGKGTLGSSVPNRAIQIFTDGVQGELAFSGPYRCLESMASGYRWGMIEMLNKAQTLDPKARLVWWPSVEVKAQDLAEATDLQVAFGCNPSRNAYGLQGGEIPEPRGFLQRFAGHHVHFGDREISPEGLVRTLDATAGMVATALFGKLEPPVRRQFYGLPGEYRTPKHGVEWRTLSSAVMCAPWVWHFVMEFARWAWWMEKLGVAQELWKWDPSGVVGALMESDGPAARRVLRDNEAVVRRFLDRKWGPQGVKVGMQMLMEGVGVAVPNIEHPNAMMKNWGLWGALGVPDPDYRFHSFASWLDYPRGLRA